MWKKQLVELLISIYKKHENLYDNNHPNYTDRVKRTNSLFEISKQLKKFEKDITVEEIRKKIHTLRTQYMRELREFENGKQGANGVIEPKLWCFYHLDFLKPYCSTRKSILKEDSDLKNSPRRKNEKHIIGDTNCDEESFTDDNDCYTEDFEISRCEEDKQQYCWKRDHIYKLIDLFEKYPVMYDPKHKDFRKWTIRKIVLQKLLKEMRKLDPEITMDVIKEKLRTLRNQFLHEVRLLKEADKNNELYIPKCWCFDRMSKLYKDIIKITPFYDNNMFDEDTIASKSEPEVENSIDSMEFEEYFDIPNDGKETFEVETVNIDTNHINEDLGNECEITMGEDVDDDFQPSKRFCSGKDELKELTLQKDGINQEISKKFKSEDINHNWLGDLVVSQLEEIAPKYHNDFAWDVQCLIRKYVIKSKTNAADATITQSSEAAPTQSDNNKTYTSHELVLSKTSNISFNISFV
ncbi:uncharacterized protein ACRADG_005912 [Cochliomyia hominivorax]